MKILLGLVGFAAVIYIVFKSDTLIKPDTDYDKMSEDEKKAYNNRKNHIEIMLFILVVIIAMITGIAKYM